MIMKWKKESLVALLFVFFVCNPVLAQKSAEKEEPPKAYTVPIGDKAHKIELVLLNTTGKQLKNVLVQVEDNPLWMKLENKEIEIAKIAPKNEFSASFSFKITGEAQVGDTSEVSLIATDNSGFSWEKTIQLSPSAPSEFELMPNYPNPFNPSTTIQYRLPAQMEVQVSVYNILGRKVATLADALQEAGQQELRWDASNMASGLYFYRVVAEGQNTERIVEQKKMMLIK
jgi:hypothetical protein